MKLSEYRKDYYDKSGKASDLARQLAFAGIALVWVFKYTNKGSENVPEELIFPSFLFALSLGLDFLQYFIAAGVYGVFHWYKEKENQKGKKEEDPQYKHDERLNWPALFCFWGKGLSIILAYFFVAKYLFIRFAFHI
jgi:hypothetical protein